MERSKNIQVNQEAANRQWIGHRLRKLVNNIARKFISPEFTGEKEINGELKAHRDEL